MATINFIKHLREKEGFSLQGIADKLGVNWRTAKKYADQLDWNKDREPRKKQHPVMAPYIEIVDAWLLEDQTLPRKQRHTAKRVFDRLVKEHGFKGSDRTVRDYVSKRKKELKLAETERYIRLEHPGGEAQVDFGTVRAVINGIEKELKALVVSFPFSNAAFIRILPAENAECFLEGLKRIFERIGAVPTKLWFDNLSAAVVSIESSGERVLTESFQRFALHYRFEYTFCNPGKGNEKGNVENKVGYSRRNWCVPMPYVSSLEELQNSLDEEAEKDLERLHYDKEVTMRALWEQEKTKLLQLPTTPYDVVRLDVAKVNKYGEVILDGEKKPVAQAQPGDKVLLKIRWNEVEVIDAQHQKIDTIPRPYMDKGQPIDWKYHLQVFRAKPRSLPYASIFKALPQSIQSWILNAQGDTRRSRVSWVLRMLDSYDLEDIAKVLQPPEAVRDDYEKLELELYRLRHPQRIFEPVVEGYTPSPIVGWEPDMRKYDALVQRKVVNIRDRKVEGAM